MKNNTFDLSGQVALITGSTQGLGEASARVLAQNGAHVIISSRKPQACEEVAARFRSEGLRAEGFPCNIGHQQDIDAIYQHISSAHGRLDVLVNNAVLSPWRTIEETDRSLMMKALETNTAGYWYMSTAAAALMKQQGTGSIINISSVAALKPSKMLALYSTFKASLGAMTRSFALEYGEFGIRVNTIFPGMFKTSLADAFNEEAQLVTQARTPLRRLGDPEEIGKVVLFFASDASSYVTGTSLIVDGGQILGS